MFDIQRQLGVQSYCFRGFKEIPALIAQVKGIGLTRTEVYGGHIDFNDAATVPAALEQFRAAGVQITSIGVQRFAGDPVEERWFEFARAAGAKMISATFDVSRTPGVYAAVERLAEKYDVLIGIHNHGGYDWLGNATMLDHVFAQTGERIGLCHDTAWCLQAGEDPLKWADRFDKRLFSVHVKDFVFDRAGRWSDVIVGSGNLRLKEYLSVALAVPRMTTVTLEYEGDEHNPGPALKECVEAVRRAL